MSAEEPAPSNAAPADTAVGGNSPSALPHNVGPAECDRSHSPDRLAGYEGYGCRNWDGYDAEPITPRAIAAARQFLCVTSCDQPPDVAPGADGTIGFQWRFSEGPMEYLFVEFGDAGVQARYLPRERWNV